MCWNVWRIIIFTHVYYTSRTLQQKEHFLIQILQHSKNIYISTTTTTTTTLLICVDNLFSFADHVLAWHITINVLNFWQRIDNPIATDFIASGVNIYCIILEETIDCQIIDCKNKTITVNFDRKSLYKNIPR